MGVILLFEYGKEILKQINKEGFKAYFVGGCVRDYLLHQEVNDIDITTNMPLDKIKEIFEVLDNGSSYLSVTIIYKGYYFEITNFRKDIEYSDHRHPKVIYTDSIYEDSLRRDYTINALYMDEFGKILDFHDGIKDLEDKELKMIGDPFLRFTEDSLRILRGLYFASKLDFNIEQNTLFAMIDKKCLLASLSEERLYQYFIKILYAKNRSGIIYINEYDIFQYIPKFKRWLNIVNPSMKEKDLLYYYYLKTKDFPILVSNIVIRKAKKLEVLLKSLDSYTLYENKSLYFEFKDILFHYGCDIIGADKRVNEFIINNDKELALSKEEIASLYDGKNKSYMIELVKEAILNGKIKNTKEEILKLLGENKDV